MSPDLKWALVAALAAAFVLGTIFVVVMLAKEENDKR